MGVFFEGAVLGLTLATFFGFGPAFFALLQTSLHRGFWSAFLLATGIFLNDLFMVIICLLGATQIVTKPENQLVFGFVAGIILMIFGVVTYTRKVKMNADDESTSKVPMPVLTYLAKGFFMNIANPFVWIFWVGVVVGITSRFGSEDYMQLIIFFSGTLVIVYLSDIIKSFAAHQAKHLMNEKRILLINKIAGLGLILFGIFMIFRSLLHF